MDGWIRERRPVDCYWTENRWETREERGTDGRQMGDGQETIRRWTGDRFGTDGKRMRDRRETDIRNIGNR